MTKDEVIAGLRDGSLRLRIPGFDAEAAALSETLQGRPPGSSLWSAPFVIRQLYVSGRVFPITIEPGDCVMLEDGRLVQSAYIRRFKSQAEFAAWAHSQVS